MLKACDQTRTYQARNLKDTARVRHTAARDRMIIMVLFDTGLRAQELCDLIIEDLNLGQNKIKVRHGKGNKGRTVRFGKRTAKAIWDYLKDHETHDDSRNPPCAAENISLALSSQHHCLFN